MASKPRMDSLTGLRFFALFHIILCHITQQFAMPEHLWQPLVNFIQARYFSTETFYALSGFILTYVYYDMAAQRLRTSGWKFMAMRLSKIYPIHVIGLLLVAPVIWFGVPHLNYPENVTGFISQLLLVQAWFPNLCMLYNGPSWALSVLLFFYAIFPFFINRLYPRIANPAALLPLLVLIYALPSAIYVFVFRPHMTPAADLFWVYVFHTNPLIHLPIFLAGSVLAKWFVGNRNRILPESPRILGAMTDLYILGIVVLLTVLPVPDKTPIAPFLRTGILAPLQLGMILLLCFGRGITCRVLSNPFVIRLGNASLAMFIIHYPLLYWSRVAGKAALVFFTEHVTSIDGFHQSFSALYRFQPPTATIPVYLVAVLALALILQEHVVDTVNNLLRKIIGAAGASVPARQPERAQDPGGIRPLAADTPVPLGGGIPEAQQLTYIVGVQPSRPRNPAIRQTGVPG